MRQSETVQLASSSARPCARLKINFEKYIVLAARTAWLCLYACRPTAKTYMYAVAEQGLSRSPPLGDVSNHRDYMCLIDHRQETGGADAKMTCIWLPCPAPLSLRRGYDPLVDGHAVPIHLPLLPSIMLVSISYHRRLFGRCDAVLIMLAVAGNLRLVRPSVCMHFTAAPKPNAIFDRDSLSTPSPLFAINFTYK